MHSNTISLDRDPLGQRPLRQRPSWTETPWTETPRQRPPGLRPPEGTWDQAARQEVTSYRDLLPCVDRMTDMCKNITLPQTSFAGSIKEIARIQDPPKIVEMSINTEQMRLQ